MKIDGIITEKELSVLLGVKIGVTGRSRAITKCIGEGLSFMEVFKHRYFLAEDILNFMLKHKKS